jgi:ribonuclease D
MQAQELQATGRWPQARHRFGEVAQTVWQPREFDTEGFWRLRGARDLDDEGRGVLRALYLFRDQRARAENRPPFKVLNNRTLVDLAERRPWNMDGLRQVRGISPRVARKVGKGLLAAIRRGATQPLSWHDRPRNANHTKGNAHGRPSPACRARFDALRAWRNAAAETRKVEPDIVLANHTLWDVAHRNPQRVTDLADDDVLAPWQVEEFGDDLLKVLGRQR